MTLRPEARANVMVYKHDNSLLVKSMRQSLPLIVSKVSGDLSILENTSPPMTPRELKKLYVPLRVHETRNSTLHQRSQC